MKNLHKLFNPRSIAVVGASPKKEKIGNILIKNIKSGSWKGKLYYVNPKYSQKRSEYFTSLRELKNAVDLALIAIPAPLVNQVIKEGALSKSRIKNFVIVSAGFKEIGKKGRKLEEELATIAEKYKLNILGPNCLGFINTFSNLNATFTNSHTKRGEIAIVSQSGALAVALLDWAQKNNFGFSKAISIGNKAVLDETDVIKYLNYDKETKAIAIYLEDIKNGEKFISAISQFDCGKPIAVIKAGKNKLGQRAISSHTGSLAQDKNIVKAVFDKFGVIEAESLEEFEDIISYLELNRVPEEKEVIIVTNAGGPGVLAADYIGKSQNLKLLRFPHGLKKSLRKILPESASVENPIDVLGDAPPERFKKVLGILSKKYRNYPLVVLLTPQNQTNPLKVANVISLSRKNFDSISTSFMGGSKVEQAVKYLGKKGIPNFASPERVLDALREAMKYKNCRKSSLKSESKHKIHLKLNVNSILERASTEKRKILNWKESSQVMKEYGLNLIKSNFIGKSGKTTGGKIKFPCVLKTDDPEIAHRWEKKGVILDIKNKKELKSALKKIKIHTRAKEFIIQPMLKKGLEIIIGMKRDRNFGPIIICGLGGTLTEILRDNALLVPPITKGEIIKKIEKLEIYPILKGFRGDKPYKIEEISTIILALQEIAIQNPGISEIDINPLILYNDGSKAEIIDAKVFLA